MSVSSMNAIEVARPVEQGGEAFVNAARYIGHALIGQDFANGGIMMDDGTPVGAQRFNPYSKLMLPLLQIAAPSNSETSTLLHYVAGRMEDDSQPAERLRADLSRLALAHDIVEGSGIVVVCSNIVATTPPHKNGKELALTLDVRDEATGAAADFFIGEYALLMKALHDNVRWHKRFAAEERRFTPLIPFGLLAEDATSREQATVVMSLGRLLPLRLVIGQRLTPMVR